ncbi:MAG TPA: hypothetical protein VKB54_07040 [Solirubrobacteraceae bacterium]|nr:hypothetical protein [Solirubrobacteraceae bacterium]
MRIVLGSATATGFLTWPGRGPWPAPAPKPKPKPKAARKAA